MSAITLPDMDIANYIKEISFRFIKPNVYVKGFNRLSRGLEKLNLSLETINTKLPENEDVTRDRLRELLKLPRLSTFAIGAIINKSVSEMSDDCCFVNVGVWHGFTFFAGLVGNPQKRAIGVDKYSFSKYGVPYEQFIQRFNKYRSSNHHFHSVDYRDYLSDIHEGKIGVYLYDGPHDYENQLEGLRAAEPYFSENCLVLVDDTNWDAPRQATLDFIEKTPHRYQILLDKTTCVGTHPTFWNGIMILQRVN